MGRSILDKNIVFLVAILAIISVAVVVMVSALRTDPVEDAVKGERMINVAVILERNGKPDTTEILMYYPGNARAALLDVPSETGLILKSLNRVDKIAAIYDPGYPKAFMEEVGRLTGATIDWYLILDQASLSSLTDLLDGMPIFLPNRVSAVLNENPINLPSGFVVLDGRKASVYAAYDDPDMPDSELVLKRQSLVQALLRRLGEKTSYVMRDDVYPVIQKRFRTNLRPESLRLLLAELARLEVDRIVLQKLTGTYRSIEDAVLLFPHYDGELVKDIVKQSLNALLNADTTAIADKVFTIEILNGTAVRGLAQKTAEIFQSFGYEVVSVGNALSTDIAKTSVVNRYGDEPTARTVANVIRCKVVEDEAIPGGSPADFVIILGRDFNGRNCVD